MATRKATVSTASKASVKTAAAKTAAVKTAKVPSGGAGYSGTPLPQKLGIKSGHHVTLLDAPEGFVASLGDLSGVHVHLKRGARSDVIVQFVTRVTQLQALFDALVAKLEPSGGLWVAWPKKSSGVTTDMTEDRVRDVALPKGYVDNKVCAIDATWSGLRCVLRKENRPK